MLRRLRIENLVLIREADLTLDAGLNAVTGETGAGKTTFAQAVGLLLGARADASLVGSGGTEAYVEAELTYRRAFRRGRRPRRWRSPPGGRGRPRPRTQGLRGRAHARVRLGQGRSPARTSRQRPSGFSRCRDSSSSAAWRVPHSSWTCSTRPAGPNSSSAGARRHGPGGELRAAQRAYDELTRDADAAAAHVAEPRRASEARRGGCRRRGGRSSAPNVNGFGTSPSSAEAASAAADAIALQEGDGAGDSAARAERDLAPLERIAPEVGAAAAESASRAPAARGRERPPRIPRHARGRPGSTEDVEGKLERIST